MHLVPCRPPQIHLFLPRTFVLHFGLPDGHFSNELNLGDTHCPPSAAVAVAGHRTANVRCRFGGPRQRIADEPRQAQLLVLGIVLGIVLGTST